ncbi:hypothetical protein H2200_000006 [Cladophialophora chaetospira]|uniref:DH domain-containing protein n=1 Tax=Cladophialophora chaetospira TaxID=386627 RepID=A0AA38XML4_9EURO|nr:hypothetical protein H2200_000006 [Cladophialophora chaetospira]
MTAQLLPSFIASPFSRRFDTNPNIYCRPRPVYPSTSGDSSDSLTPFRIHEDSEAYSSSLLSVVSASTQTNNSLPVFPLHSAANTVSNSNLLPSNGSNVSSAREKSGSLAARPVYTHLRGETEPTPRRPATAKQSRGALTELLNEEKRKYGSYDMQSPQGRPHDGIGTSSFTDLYPTAYGTPTHTPGHARGHAREWLSSFDQSPQELDGTPLWLETSSRLAQPKLLPLVFHRKRQSTASSGAVHTMKTASLSNASFSLAPRSLRFGRSTDSSGIFYSNPRHSVDSDRPPTSASVDEAAFRRAIKRRQILLELVATEEGYIADLKALIYLYSTLLATSVTVSSRIRSSILRNVHDLLSLHERLLERLHQAAYDAAARKWADTTSPRRLGSPGYHKRWKSLESNNAARFGRSHRRTRSSMDSSEVCRGRTYLGGAEPQDVADVAAIFTHFLNDFLVYEEYCANHSLISHELQRHAPMYWSTYESGIESLARSLIALDQKAQNERKGLTVGDLLIKPIQRMTKYPLLFNDLLKQTPVADCPNSHSELESILTCLREVVQTVNKATDNRETRNQIQRRWSLQTRLNFDKISLAADQFRMLGNVQLCGVLHVAWQSRNGRVDGRYGLCTLFDSSFIIALPAGATAKFEAIAFLHLPDVKVESASDGRGLQCHSTLHTWKICFETGGHLHEFILSACSAIEEHAWKEGMRVSDSPARRTDELFLQIPSTSSLDLRSIGQVYSQQSSTLSRNPSVQRAATVGNRANICQVIIRNTHNPQDLGEFRQPSSSAINRSQSHMTSNRVVVLAPKRSERARLESALGDVWTKEKLPYPGMIGSRGGQIIRASAGSLVRKLSLASLQAPFSRRSRSVSLASRKSFDLSIDSRRSRTKQSTPVFEVRKESIEEGQPTRSKPREIPEVDTMDNVISRMIGHSVSKRLSGSHADQNLTRKETRRQKSVQESDHELRPEDPAEIFYSEEKEAPEKEEVIEEGLAGKKKRWSNPLGILKVLSGDGFRHMLYSSR